MSSEGNFKLFQEWDELIQKEKQNICDHIPPYFTVRYGKAHNIY